MHRKCQINGLFSDNAEVREQNIVFHHFPSGISRQDICKEWLDFVGNEMLQHLPPEQLWNKLVCSRHFHCSDYPGPGTKRLYKHAVPNRNVPHHEPGPPQPSPSAATTAAAAATTPTATTCTDAATVATTTTGVPEDASGPRPPDFVRKNPIIIPPITDNLNLTPTSSLTAATFKTSVVDATAAISTFITTTCDTTSTPDTSITINTSPITTSDTPSTPAVTSTTTYVTASIRAAIAVTYATSTAINVPAVNAVTCATSTTTHVTASIPAANAVTCATSTTRTNVTASIPAAIAVTCATSTTRTTVTASIPAANAVTCATSTTTTVTNSIPAASTVTRTTSTTATIATSSQSPAAGEAFETDAEENFVEEEEEERGDDGEPYESVKVTCRLCACNVKKEVITPIFPPVFSSGESLLEKINMLLPEKVKIGDGLPTHVCKTCVTKVENCVFTIKRFIFADKKLRRLLEKSESAMHDHITLVQPHPLKVKRLEEADRNKGRLHTLTIVASEPLKLVEARRPRPAKKSSEKFLSTQNSRVNASKRRYPPRKFLTLKTSYSSKPLYYRILPAKAARSKRKANSPEVTASEDAPGITAGEGSACGFSSGEEGGVENNAGKGVYEECDVDSVLFNIFPCSFCDKAFPARKHKRIHEASDHVGETPIPAPKMRYQCYACKKRFRFPKHLKDHIRERHLPPEYKCEICRAIFLTKRRAAIHNRKHSGEKLFSCNYCNERFSQLKELLVHRRIHTKKPSRALSCQVCGKPFKKRSLVRAHEIIHDRTLCHICGKSLPKALLKQHVEDHGRTHLCPFCGKTFNNIMSFFNHKRRAHKPRPQRAKTFQCSVCDRSFASKEYVRRHMLVHSSLKNFKCESCPSTFKHERNLQTHRKIHRRKSIAVAGTGPYTCLLCGQQFESMIGYHRHTARHLARPFECPTCSKRYLWHSNFIKHMRCHADSQQPSPSHICLRCGVSFKNKQALDDHVCQVTDEKPYKCSFCGCTFLQRQILLTHIQNFHKDEKPVDLGTTVTIPEDAEPTVETNPLGQAVQGFQEAFLANIYSEQENVFNPEL